MKKPIIALIAVFAAAGISVGAFMGVKNAKEKEEKQQAEIISDRNLLLFDSESINKIEFDCDEGRYAAELKDGVWSLTEGGEFPLDQTYFQLLCTYTCDLTADDSFENAEPEKFGLDAPETITLHSDSASYKIFVGDISPTNDFYYITVDGKEKIYTVDSINGSVLKAEKMMLKSKDFVPYGNRGIENITVTRDGKQTYSVSYDKDGDTWYMSDKFDMLTFDVTSVSTMVSNIIRLSASIENMLDDELTDLSKYGFDKPTAEAVITGTDGTKCSYVFNENYDPKGEYVLAMEINSRQVMKFTKSELYFIECTPIDFLLLYMPITDITKVREFEFSFDGGETEKYTMDVNADKASCLGKELDLSDGTMDICFRNFFNSFNTLKISAVDTEIAPPLENPILEVSYTLADGTTKTHHLTDAGNGKYYAFIDGKYCGALTDKSKVKGLNSIEDFHKQILEAAGV